MYKLFNLHTDGSCLGNPGPGGWAALLVDDDGERLISDGHSYTTNNKMELQAVLEGLKAIPSRSVVTVHTDSTYVKNGITDWIKGWKLNQWKTMAGKPVKNRDLWEAIDILTEKYQRIDWEWVKAHSGNPENERVDAEARRQATVYQRKSRRN